MVQGSFENVSSEIRRPQVKFSIDFNRWLVNLGKRVKGIAGEVFDRPGTVLAGYLMCDLYSAVIKGR